MDGRLLVGGMTEIMLKRSEKAFLEFTPAQAETRIRLKNSKGYLHERDGTHQD